MGTTRILTALTALPPHTARLVPLECVGHVTAVSYFFSLGFDGEHDAWGVKE